MCDKVDNNNNKGNGVYLSKNVVCSEDKIKEYGLDIPTHIIELAKDYEATGVRREKYVEEEDYDNSFNEECEMRDIGYSLAAWILKVSSKSDSTTEDTIKELEQDLKELKEQPSCNGAAINRIESKIKELRGDS